VKFRSQIRQKCLFKITMWHSLFKTYFIYNNPENKTIRLFIKEDKVLFYYFALKMFRWRLILHQLKVPIVLSAGKQPPASCPCRISTIWTLCRRRPFLLLCKYFVEIVVKLYLNFVLVVLEQKLKVSYMSINLASSPAEIDENWAITLSATNFPFTN